MKVTDLFALAAYLSSALLPQRFPGFDLPSPWRSGIVSIPSSLSLALLNLLTVDNNIFIQVAPVIVIAPVVNAPTCNPYISYIARPQYTPVPIIPPPIQPTCLNRQLYPKLEVPAPRSLWLMPPPFLPPSEPQQPPFCRPNDEPPRSCLWLPLVVSLAVGLAMWNFTRLQARRPPCYRSYRSGCQSVKEVENISCWSQSGFVAPRRKKVEYRDRVVQPRMSISSLPSLPLLNEATDMVHTERQLSVEVDYPDLIFAPASSPVPSPELSSTPAPPDATPSVEVVQLDIVEVERPVLAPASPALPTETSSPAPRDTTPSVGPVGLDTFVVADETAVPTVAPSPPQSPPQIFAPTPRPYVYFTSPLMDPNWAPTSAPERELPAVASPVSPSSPPVPDESLPSPSELATPPAAPLPVLECGINASRWAPSPVPEAPAVNSHASEPSSSQHKSEQKNQGLYASRWAPTPAPSSLTTPPQPKKKRVRTKGPKPKPVPVVIDATTRPATPPLPPSEVQGSGTPPAASTLTSTESAPSQPTCVEKNNGLSASLWAPGPSSEASLPVVKKKRVRTKGPRPAPIPTVEETTTRPATPPLPPSKVQGSGIPTPSTTPATPPLPPSEVRGSGTPTTSTRPATPPLPPSEVQGSGTPSPSPKIDAETIKPSFSLIIPENASSASSSLPTPPPSAKKAVGIEASIWATPVSPAAPPSPCPPPAPSLLATVPAPSKAKVLDPLDLVASEQRNEGVGASRWASAPDPPKKSGPTPAASTTKALDPTDRAAFEQRNEGVGASRWATAPDLPSNPGPYIPRRPTNNGTGKRPGGGWRGRSANRR
ncbi:hypothetical protein DXG01_002676 [Tephrocybe rancida]|nr:hypothetical protein DXG01_002676 [Tephrocybe rancida]